MNSTPQVETAEIADADLDNVSGGLHLNTLDSTLGLAQEIAPGAFGLVNTVSGVAQGVTGVNLAPAQGFVAGL
ncbi:type A2 lantipeptide [Streptomyces sp. enrichment culture]|uniref:type A2 lantipeptide n=1 Tax=Streptomyces sp. enrichment culture TaxID=1795815 RepID=UPI003F566232